MHELFIFDWLIFILISSSLWTLSLSLDIGGIAIPPIDYAQIGEASQKVQRHLSQFKVTNFGSCDVGVFVCDHFSGCIGRSSQQGKDYSSLYTTTQHFISLYYVSKIPLFISIYHYKSLYTIHYLCHFMSLYHYISLSLIHCIRIE